MTNVLPAKTSASSTRVSASTMPQSGTQLATQVVGQNYVEFKQASPLGTTQRGVFTTGSTSRIEFDPVGATVRINPNSPPDHSGGVGDLPSGGDGPLDSRFSTLANPLSNCSRDGILMPCELARRGEGTSADVVGVDPFVSVAYRSRRRKPVWVEVDTSTAVSTGDNELTIYSGPGGYFDWVDDPDEALEVFLQTGPQNSQPLPTDLKDRVANIVNNPNTDCAEFIKKLIGNLKGKAFSDDPMKLFQRVENGKGFRLGNTGKYAGLAGITSGKRKVTIRPVDSTTNPKLSEHQAYAYAVTALNELMHHAKNSGVYTDRELAVAIFPLLSSEQQAANPLPTTSDVDRISVYFHSLFNLHCRSLTGE